MTEAETVGLWLGIVVGIAGVVLAVVAIWFAMWVHNRGTQVSNQTIQSLQKIETTNERLSADTTGLIKAAWDKMLGQVGNYQGADEARQSANEIASGISSEMRAELAEKVPAGSDDAQELDALIENMRATLSSQLASRYESSSPGRRVDELTESLLYLSPNAQELARAISHRQWHLTRKGYRSLLNSPVGQGLLELRRAGLMVPLSHGSSSSKDMPVYYFPPGTQDSIRAAMHLVPDNPPDVKEMILLQLQKIQYLEGPHGSDG